MKTVKSRTNLRDALPPKPKKRTSMLAGLQEQVSKTADLGLSYARSFAKAVDAQALAIATRAAETVEALKAVAHSYVEQVREVTTAAAESVALRVSAVVQSVRDRRSILVARLSSIRAKTFGLLSAAQDAAVTEYRKLRRSGLRSWVWETCGTVRDVAGQTVSQLRYGVLSAYSLSLTYIHDSLTASRMRVSSVVGAVRERIYAVASDVAEARRLALNRAMAAATATKVKAVELGTSTREMAKEGKVQATVVGAASGAATLGAGGAIAGLATGSALGAAVGLVPAIFTFGLSIPVGAAVGGSAGFLTGAAVGSAAGAMGGGAAGYGVYAEREQIREGTKQTLQKIGSGADLVKGTAVASAGFVKSKASELRSRLARSRAAGA